MRRARRGRPGRPTTATGRRRPSAAHPSVAQAILASPESNTHDVQTLYRWPLRRGADPAGLGPHVGAANAGVTNEVIAAGIVGPRGGASPAPAPHPPGGARDEAVVVTPPASRQATGRSHLRQGGVVRGHGARPPPRPSTVQEARP